MNAPRHAPATINLHIERVVLDGGAFTRAQLGRLQGSMERELMTLLRAGGLPAHGRAETVARGNLPAPPRGLAGQSPEELGRAMARGVYDSLQPMADTRP